MRLDGYRSALAWAFLVSMTGLAIGRATFADVVAAVSLVLGALSALATRRAVVPAWVLAMPAAVLAIGMVAAILDPRPLSGLLIYVASLLMAPLLLCMHALDSRRLHGLMAAFALGAAVNALVGVYDAATPGVVLADVTGFGGDLRPAGLTTHSNQLGLVCSLAAPMAVHLAGRAHAARWWVVWGILAGGALASGSRGAIVGFALAMAVYLVAARRVRLKRLLQIGALGAIGVAIALRAGLGVGLARLLGQGDYAAGAAVSDRERELLGARAQADLLNNFWTGIGYIDNASAHNYYLQIGRSAGVLAILVVVLGSLYALQRGWRNRDSHPAMPAILAGAACWFVVAAQHNAFNQRFLWVPLGFIAAVEMVQRRQARDLEASRVHPGTSLADSRRAVSGVLRSQERH